MVTVLYYKKQNVEECLGKKLNWLHSDAGASAKTSLAVCLREFKHQN
jgi:hypothetical protein